MRCLIFLFCTLFCLSSFAQKTDSLLLLIKQAKTDTARVNLMNIVAGKLTANNLDSAIRYSQLVIAESNRIHYLPGEVAARQNLAEAFARKSNFAAAKKEIEKAETIAGTLHDSLQIALVYAVYGMIYGMQSQYDSSILYYKKNISLLQNTPDSPRLSKSYQNIAISYQMQSDLRQAVYYQTKALRLTEAAHDTARLAYLSVNMGISYELLDDRKKAEESYLKSIAFAKAAGVKNVEMYGYSNLSTFYEKKDNRKSYEFAVKAIALGEQTGDSAMIASNSARAAYALAKQGNIDEAERLITKAIAIAEVTDQPIIKFQAFVAAGSIKKLQQKCSEAIPLYEKSFSVLQESDLYSDGTADGYYELADCYEKEGYAQKALTAYKKATQIKDSVLSRDNIRKTTELSMQYDFDKQQEIQRTQKIKEDRENTIRLLFLIGFLLVFITLSTVALFAYRREQKAKKLVNEQKNQIQSTLEELRTTQAQLIQSEKMASLGELTAGIAHEIQNPLNFVNNFSELNSEMIDELKEELSKNNIDEAVAIINDLQSNEQKITHHGKRADAIVKGMLQHSRKSTGQKEPTDINALCDEYLRLSYHGLRAKDKSFQADFTTRFDESIGKINIVSQDMGRVLLNVFSNAFYAVNEKTKKVADKKYHPAVIVATKKTNDKIEIQIEDNGTGIPQSAIDKIFQPFFTTKPTGEGTGLGLSLSYDIITKEHNGLIRVDSKESEGSRFMITLPQ